MFSCSSFADSGTIFWLVSQLNSNFSPIPSVFASKHKHWKEILFPILKFEIWNKVYASCVQMNGVSDDDGWAFVLLSALEECSDDESVCSNFRSNLDRQLRRLLLRRCLLKVLRDDVELPLENGGNERDGGHSLEECRLFGKKSSKIFRWKDERIKCEVQLRRMESQSVRVH